MSPRQIPVGRLPFHVMELYPRPSPPFTSLFVRFATNTGCEGVSFSRASGEDMFAPAVTDILRVFGHQADFFRRRLVREFVITPCWSPTNFLVPQQFCDSLLARLPVFYMLYCRIDSSRYSNPGPPVWEECHLGLAKVKKTDFPVDYCVKAPTNLQVSSKYSTVHCSTRDE